MSSVREVDLFVAANVRKEFLCCSCFRTGEEQSAVPQTGFFSAAFGSKDSLLSLAWGGIFSKADPHELWEAAPQTNPILEGKHHDGDSTSPPARLRKAKHRQWWQFVQQQGKEAGRGWAIRAVWKEGWQPARDNLVQFATLLISNKDKAAEWFSLERLELSCQWLWLIDSTPGTEQPLEGKKTQRAFSPLLEDEGIFV